MKCLYCDKYCKNNNSLIQHQIRCKLNSDKIKVISNFILFNKNVKEKKIKKTYSNQYTKAEKLGYAKPEMSEKSKEKIRQAAKKQKWTKERRDNLSKSMQKAVDDYPESYNNSGVFKRYKRYNVIDSLGNNISLIGTYELEMSKYLDRHNIKWTKIIKEKIYYFYEDKKRRYFPDFYIIDYNFYIETKGYIKNINKEISKWSSVINLLVLMKDDIELIKCDKYKFPNFLLNNKI